jgi:hypothetical protein
MRRSPEYRLAKRKLAACSSVPTFIESMRSLGYRTTGSAINELIDNAGEAGAEN